MSVVSWRRRSVGVFYLACQVGYRLEHFYLGARFFDVYFRVYQGGEAILQLEILRFGIVFFQHVDADEFVEVIEHFYTYDLIEEAQGLGGAHPEELRDAFGVAHGPVEKLYQRACSPVRSLQPAPQHAFPVERLEVFLYLQGHVRQAEAAPQFSAREPAHLEDGHYPLVGIGERGEQYRVSTLVAQGLGGDSRSPSFWILP